MQNSNLDLILERKDEHKSNLALRRMFVSLQPDYLANLITEAFRVEVMSRGYEPEITEVVAKRINAVSVWLSDPTRKPFLILYGESPGTGKTALARAVYSVLGKSIPRLKQEMTTEAYRISATIEKEREESIKAVLPSGVIAELFDQNPRQAWGMLSQDYPDVYKSVHAIHQEYEAQRIAVLNKAHSFSTCDEVSFYTSHELVYDAESSGRDCFRFINLPKGVLFLDDVGAEALECIHMGNRILPVTEILLSRYDRRAPTIITSNLSDAGLAQRYGARVGDRLNEVADKIAFTGASYRR